MPGTAIAKPADVILCAERLTWMKNGKKGPYRVHLPRQFVGDYIQQVGGQGAKPLRGLTRLPHIDNSGNIHCFAGYDPKICLYNDQPIQLDIPATVSPDEARQLVDKLFYPFSQYRFKDPERGRATVLAAIFTPLERAHLPLAPMFVFRSAMAGTGKGKIAQAVSQLAYATAPATMTWGGDAEEFEKRISAILMQTPSVVLIDNANGVVIKGAILESMITEGCGKLRILGRSEMPKVYNRAFLMLTGNNAIVTGDMARRTLIIDIEPKSADPERDRYPFDPVVYVTQHRRELLEATFSIMRAFRQAGMPQDRKLPAAGSLGEWSRKVRDLVYWLTGYDVSEGFHLNKAEDPHRQNDASLLEALFNFYFIKSERRCGEFKGADVIALYEAHRNPKDPNSSPVVGFPALSNALNEVFDNRRVSVKNFGYWARSVTGAYYGDFVLEAHPDKHTKTNAYTVRCTDRERIARQVAAVEAEEARRAAEEARRKEEWEKTYGKSHPFPGTAPPRPRV